MKSSGLLDDDSQGCKRPRRGAARAIVAAVAIAGGAACSSNHKVSPWGTADGPSLAPYREVPDLDAQLARTDGELAALGLHLDGEYEAENDGVKFVARRGAPSDPLAWERVSTRVVTPYGVVFGAGPASFPDRTQANDLAMPEGLSSPFFLLRSERRVLALLLRAADERLAVYRLTPRGSTEVPIQALVAPRRALDVDDDGYVDLVAEIVLAVPASGAAGGAGLKLTVVSTFDGAGFDDRSDAARGLQARRASAVLPEGTPADTVAALGVWCRAAAGTLAEKDVDAEMAKTFAKRTDPFVDDLRAWAKKMAKRQARPERKKSEGAEKPGRP